MLEINVRMKNNVLIVLYHIIVLFYMKIETVQISNAKM
jgi:hypothetical protein